MVKDDKFQSIETYYRTLLEQSNSPIWILGCHVGMGLMEYFKKNYTVALEHLWKAIEISSDEKEKCQIIGNIYCILANVYREMNNVDMALNLYTATKQNYRVEYFFEKTNYSFWHMFIYDEKFNPFVRDDIFFHYCDQPDVNLAVLYMRTEQWELARKTSLIILNKFSERERIGETEIFVKLLGYNDGKSRIHDWIKKNRTFLGGKTQALWLNVSDQKYILYAYEDLVRYYLKHNCFDHAYLCCQEILQGEINVEFSTEFSCFQSIATVHEMKEEYNETIIWLRRAITLAINGPQTLTFESPVRRLYPKFLLICNERLNESLSTIDYMEEIIDILVRRTDTIDAIYDLIVTIYKITVDFYHSRDKSKIECIYEHIHSVLDRITLQRKHWTKWLCLGKTCCLKKFHDRHYCEPIIDENRQIYIRFYKKILPILSHNASNEFVADELCQCKQILLQLEYT